MVEYLNDNNQLTNELKQSPVGYNILDSIFCPLVIVNKNTEIVFFNKPFTEKHNISNNILGKKFGDIVDCSNSDVGDDGCATSKMCSYCCMQEAITHSLTKTGKKDFKGIVLTKNNNSLEVHVKSTPLQLNNNNFGVLTIKDISPMSQKRSLEKIFLHDINNTLSILNGYMNMYKENPQGEDLLDKIISVHKRLLDEILEQRSIRDARNHTLKPKLQPMNSLATINRCIEIISPFLNNLRIEVNIDSQAEDFNFISDESLLHRSIISLLKNAAEAALDTNETIVINTYSKDHKTYFSVFDSSYIPENVQANIFKHSYTTKSTGTGLGTYTTKLYIENILKGKVTFTSTEEEGTTFTIELPKPV